VFTFLKAFLFGAGGLWLVGLAVVIDGKDDNVERSLGWVNVLVVRYPTCLQDFVILSIDLKIELCPSGDHDERWVGGSIAWIFFGVSSKVQLSGHGHSRKWMILHIYCHGLFAAVTVCFDTG
jgi:hypothetical protein